MDAISFEAAKLLVSEHPNVRAEIRCFDGRKWILILHGSNSFVLKSDRQTPRRFATLETAIAELHHLGFDRCEVNWAQWQGKASRRSSVTQPTETISE